MGRERVHRRCCDDRADDRAVLFGTASPDLVQVDFGWWKVAGYDLIQVVWPGRPRTAWIVWRGDHVLHINEALPDAGAGS